jgi:peroxiredoxin
VLLEFLRGTWDPASRERWRAIEAAVPELSACGVRPLLVTCEAAGRARDWWAQQETSLTLLLDTERSAATRYGVLRPFSFGAFRVPLPASFLIDRCAYVRYAYVGRRPIDAAPLAEIIERARAVQAEERRGGGGKGAGTALGEVDSRQSTVDG